MIFFMSLESSHQNIFYGIGGVVIEVVMCLYGLSPPFFFVLISNLLSQITIRREDI